MIACVAVDWGTSSFRLWALSAVGEVLAERRSAEGMGRLAPEDFAPVLEAHLAALSVPREVPVLICGMAGAAAGWRNVPYLPAPCLLASIAGGAVQVGQGGRDIRILPGVAQHDACRPDVMRGEETLLLGLLQGEHPPAALLCCLPGTHSKWARIENGCLTGFSTYMTGELFARLTEGGTLAGFMQAGIFVPEAFEAGLRAALAEPAALTRALFGLRAGALLCPDSAPEAASRLSGLLIGQEIAGLGATPKVPVTLVASGLMAERYQQAFAIAGLPHRLCDADPLARAGLLAAARAIWPALSRPRMVV